ncbi:hypothetical protein LDFHOB_00120 [Candidatus Electronema aureum]
MSRTPLAFLSYVNLNDQHDYGDLTQFRERLSGEVRFLTGEAFDIFQDRKDIAWGQQWQERLDTSLAAVTFLLPIITPAFFKSTACRAELERFLKREEELGRGDLILPVYYATCPVLKDKEKLKHDPLAQIIAARQYADWRELRHEPFTSPQLRKAITKIAEQIVAALERSQSASSRAAATRSADTAKEAPSGQQSEKESKKAASQSNKFQSGGGGQSTALGEGAIGTQNNYYGPQCRSAVRSIILVCALIGTALFAANHYPTESAEPAKAETQRKPAAKPELSPVVEPVKPTKVEEPTVTVETPPQPAAKPELSTVVVDAQKQGDYTTITDALKAVKAGDKILVRPGVYKEGIT